MLDFLFFFFILCFERWSGCGFRSILRFFVNIVDSILQKGGKKRRFTISRLGEEVLKYQMFGLYVYIYERTNGRSLFIIHLSFPLPINNSISNFDQIL